MIIGKNLSRKYGELAAVDNVSFEIPSGQVVGLLGHNGAGKTTIMKMITGFLEPTEGTVLIDNQDIEENRIDLQKRIGYLPENCPIYSEMTVVDYLEYIAELRDIDSALHAKYIREALAKTKLTDRAADVISTLSKGYRQRVGVAQAILHQPDILILDEPTSGLDPNQINEMRDLIKELGKEATVIISTHILQEVDAVCDRVLIMVRGKIAKDAMLEELTNTRSIILETDQEHQKTFEPIKDLPKIKKLNFISQDDDVWSYKIDLSEQSADMTPQIADRLIAKGIKLHAIHYDTHKLENVFREVSAQN